MATHNNIGILGENLAAQFLTENNYRILEKNWRFLKAEIDIIALKKDCLIIVEVKTRTSPYFGNPEEFITPKKRKLLITAANAYVEKHNLNYNVRFDVIAILKTKKATEINHITEAFLSFEE